MRDKDDIFTKAMAWAFIAFAVIVGLTAFFTGLSAEKRFEPLQEILTEAGFEKHGDIWTLDEFSTDVYKTDHYMTGWYNQKENLGAISIKSVVATEMDDGSFRFNDAFDYISFSYDYEANEITILEKYSYRY